MQGRALPPAYHHTRMQLHNVCHPHRPNKHTCKHRSPLVHAHHTPNNSSSLLYSNNAYRHSNKCCTIHLTINRRHNNSSMLHPLYHHRSSSKPITRHRVVLLHSNKRN